MNILILGIDSALGQSLAAALTKSGHQVIGTSRRKNSGHIFFDLAEDHTAWPHWPDGIDAAFIAAAMTKQQDCANNPEQAQFINVTQTLKLIETLRAKSIPVVFPSTNLVLSPIGPYAETKATVEKTLNNKPDVTIARLPKILDGQSGILQDWTQKIKDGTEIRAFTNLKIAPVSLSYATNFLIKLLGSRPGGLWQISGASEISYVDLAKSLGAYLKKEPVITAAEAPGPQPTHPGLDASTTLKKFGLAPQSLNDVFKDSLS